MINTRKGFTLIELLVVIGIIAILATLSIIAFSTARRKARDSTRLNQVEQMQKALELYYQDNGEYPSPGARGYAYWTSTSIAEENQYCGSRWCDERFSNGLEAKLAPYISGLPGDPLGIQNTYRYYYDSDSGDNYQTYGLRVRLEGSEYDDLAANDGGYNVNFYEVGDSPKYCTDTYIAGNARIWITTSAAAYAEGGDGNTVCRGGN